MLEIKLAEVSIQFSDEWYAQTKSQNELKKNVYVHKEAIPFFSSIQRGHPLLVVLYNWNHINMK